MSIIIISISYLSILPFTISIDSDSIVLTSAVNTVAALNLLNLLDTLIKVFNIEPLTHFSDLSKDLLLIMGMRYF